MKVGRRIRSLRLGALLAVATSFAGGAEQTNPATDYASLGFDVLTAFPFAPEVVSAAPTAARVKAAETQIPAAIRQWHGRKVTISGFMIPARVERGLVTEFLLMRFTAAAMNTNAPALNDWVQVRVRPGVQPSLEFPITCCGVFHVGAVFENGYLTAIYQLEAEKVVLPWLGGGARPPERPANGL